MDVRKKIEQAKSQGFSDEQINSYLKQKGIKAPKENKGLGGFLTSLISEGSGTGGALAGASAGAAIGSVVPGIGTAIGGLLGAGLGGGIGAFGGRLAENKIRDDEFRVGDAAKEGAITGVLSASPLKLLKGAGAAGSALTKGAGKEVAKEAAERAIESPGFLAKLTGKAGTRLTEEGSGLALDKTGNVSKLAQQAEVAGKFAGAPRKQATKMTDELGKIGTQIDDALKKYPEFEGKTVAERLRQGMADVGDERFLDLDLSSGSVQKRLEGWMSKLEGAQGADKVNEILKKVNSGGALKAEKKLLDPTAGTLSAPETALVAIKRAADDMLKELPEVGALKQQYAQIKDVLPEVAKASKQGVSSSLVGGVKAKAPVQALRGAQSKAGAALTGISDLPASVGTAGRALAGGFLSDLVAPGQPQQAGAEDISMGGEMPTATAGTDTSLLGMEQEPQEDLSNPYHPANAEKNVQAILAQGGKQKDVAEYLANVETFQKLQELQNGGTSKPLNSTAAGNVTDLQNGIANIRLLSQDFARSGANNPLVGFIRGKNPLDTEAQSLQANIARVKQVIGKALEGGVLRKEDEVKYAKILPTLNDTDAVAQRKIQSIADDLDRKLVLYQQNLGGGGGGTDLASLLSTTTGE